MIPWASNNNGGSPIKGFGENIKEEEEEPKRIYFRHDQKKKRREANPYPDDGKRRSLNRADVISSVR